MKKIKYQEPSMRPPKAMMQLVDAFSETYSPVMHEEDAQEVFTVSRLREYFQAWPVPKMPDPLPPYLNELERRGFAMRTSYDGRPALFCILAQYPCMEDADERRLRSGQARLGTLIRKRLTARRPGSNAGEPDEEEEEEEDADDEEE